MILIPLKLKYRNPNVRVEHRSGLDPIEGTLVWLTEKHACKGRTGNSHGNTPKYGKSTAGKGARRRSYGPW